MATVGIRKFTGYIATDGSTHETLAKATKYANDCKVKEALKDKFSSITDATAGSHEVEGQYWAIDDEGLPEFLFAHRDAIQACLNQKATTRTQRKPKAVAVDA